jgi:hypothetical protein
MTAAVVGLVFLAGHGALPGAPETSTAGEAVATSFADVVESDTALATELNQLSLPPACVDPAAALMAVDAALAAHALLPAQQGLTLLLSCPKASDHVVSKRLEGARIMLAARASLLEGEPGHAVRLLQMLATEDPEFPGLATELHFTLTGAGRAALDAGRFDDAVQYCGEALALRPGDATALACIVQGSRSNPERQPLSAGHPASIAVPPPTSLPSPTNTVSALALSTVLPEPSASAVAPIALDVPPTPLPATCQQPSAWFATPVVVLDTPTTLMVVGVEPGSTLTLSVAETPGGYSAAPRRINVRGDCHSEIPMVFRAGQHPTGPWTFELRGTKPNGEPFEISTTVTVAA